PLLRSGFRQRSNSCEVHRLSVAAMKFPMARKGRKFGASFSWKRAMGISAAKGRLSRKIGIPLTRSGRQRKLGKMMSGGGCFVATACYGSEHHPVVKTLQDFRDQRLATTTLGRTFVAWYYRNGPRLA